MNFSITLDRPLTVFQPPPNQLWQPCSHPVSKDWDLYSFKENQPPASTEESGWIALPRVGLPTPPIHPKDMSSLSLNPVNNSYGVYPHDKFERSYPNPSVPSMNSSSQVYSDNKSSGMGDPYRVQSASKPQNDQNSSLKPMGQTSHRKQPSNSIASYLQIPPSINDSKGSLAEFAAQITCLFWFETATTLQWIEDLMNAMGHIQHLIPEAVPTTGFRKFVTTILSTTQVSQNVVLLALLFIYRLKKFNSTVRGKPGSEYRLLTVALMLGNKFLDDNTYTNKTWAEVSGISVQEIHIMEVEFLSNMRYTLFTSETEWKQWHAKLARFWTYFDRASKAPLEAPRPQGPITPTLIMPPSLPSPPGSTHTSPPYLPTQTTPSHANHSWQQPQGLPQYNTQSPIRQLPDVEFPPSQRKRSYDEQLQGPPAKRITRSMTPSTMTPATMTPATLAPLQNPIAPPQLPRLPAPNVGPVGQPQSQPLQPLEGQNHAARLPLPGTRAMSTVYHGVPNWSAPHSLPPSNATAPTPLSIQTNMLPSIGEHSRHQSPFTTSSVHSSPIPSLAAHSQQPNHRSPSYFLHNRNSPYRPIRSVNTLLIPPPSASMQAPRSLNYDQMRYQPLGKATEPRTGVVPYMHHDNWSQLQDPQVWPILPQPGSQG